MTLTKNCAIFDLAAVFALYPLLMTTSSVRHFKPYWRGGGIRQSVQTQDFHFLPLSPQVFLCGNDRQCAT